MRVKKVFKRLFSLVSGRVSDPVLVRSIPCLICLALFSPGIAHSPSVAAELTAPAGQILLTVDGNIANRDSSGKARFDRPRLKALGLHRLTTTNPFVSGTHTFEGVLLRDVLDVVRPLGSVLLATAVDGYTIRIPVKDAYRFDVLLALDWNGKPMTIRRKGPLWVIYPIDQFSELKNVRYSGRSIWQIISIKIEE